MGFYDIISNTFTIIGTFVLIYRTIHELDVPSKVSKREKMCTKWVIFVLFLKLEYWILAVLEIIPLGALALLAVKFLLFMPENPISHKIYKTIQKRLERIKLDEYHSYIGVYLSKTCRFAVIALIKIIHKVAEYVNSREIEEIEVKIMQIIKLLEYKKAAVNMRSQATKSQVNKDLNETQFNTSASEEEIISEMQPKKQPKSALSQQFSKLLADIDDEDNQEVMRLRAELMISKPNKVKGLKAKYEETTIDFYIKTCKVTFTNPHQAVEQGTLKQVKWITKNMINIEMVLEQGRSKVVKLVQKEDVARFVEPICEIMQKRKVN